MQILYMADNMNHIKSICISFFAFGLFAVALYGYDKSQMQQQEIAEIKQKHLIVVEDESDTTETMETLEAAKYIVLQKDQYLTIYCSDRTTIYAYTDIQYDLLPKSVKEQIDQGLSFSKEKSLFDFLENYSS